MDQYALFGNPVQQSWSPRIHTLFAEQTKQQINYQAILAPLDQFSQTLDAFQIQGGKGANVTAPFKQQAFQLVNTINPRAKLAKAINTIQFNPDGSRFGDNTDGIGLLRDLTQHYNFSIAGKRILILGAGGAVHGILNNLLAEQPALLVIANRTKSTAQALVAEYAHPCLQACSLAQFTEFQFDLIINATSASLNESTLDLPKNLLSPQVFCYDMSYGKKMTPFLEWAKNNDANKISDGLGMLVEQAAESFYVWRGVRPDAKAVLRQLRPAKS